jgi:hypothetical protein
MIPKNSSVATIARGAFLLNQKTCATAQPPRHSPPNQSRARDAPGEKRVPASHKPPGMHANRMTATAACVPTIRIRGLINKRPKPSLVVGSVVSSWLIHIAHPILPRCNRTLGGVIGNWVLALGRITPTRACAGDSVCGPAMAAKSGAACPGSTSAAWGDRSSRTRSLRCTRGTSRRAAPSTSATCLCSVVRGWR